MDLHLFYRLSCLLREVALSPMDPFLLRGIFSMLFSMMRADRNKYPFIYEMNI